MHIFCHFFAQKFGSLKYGYILKFAQAFLIIYIPYIADDMVCWQSHLTQMLTFYFPQMPVSKKNVLLHCFFDDKFAYVNYFLYLCARNGWKSRLVLKGTVDFK